MLVSNPKLFGSPTRTRTLLAIALLKESYVQQLAGLLELEQPAVFRIVDGLEHEGVLVSRCVGRTRTVSLNPRMYGVADLEAFLLKYSKSTDIEERVANVRRRPRRHGKAL